MQLSKPRVLSGPLEKGLARRWSEASRSHAPMWTEEGSLRVMGRGDWAQAGAELDWRPASLGQGSVLGQGGAGRGASSREMGEPGGWGGGGRRCAGQVLQREWRTAPSRATF